MKFALAAALLITLPAVVAIVAMGLFSDARIIALAAIASVALNSLPFLVAGFFLRKGGDASDLSH